MAKRLTSATIVQQHLYVERQADRQLDTAIDDMGRPPYVLVARQMGKTNLLINMKRRRETRGDVVAYFDLSTRYESPRSFFRSVIDGLVEQLAPNMPQEQDQIDAIRRASYEPITEYERSLRIVLRAIGHKKLVLVLDEVDSLIKVPYSDVIFAHVRSIYFLRVNHSEYWRLTYVLSGVAEPATLIKDKNISPFNIGEKIFLSDFSKAEFGMFMQNAGLSFDVSVRDEIFRLTSGNPRMVWDICARVEDEILSGGTPTADSVRSIVDNLYLTNFDTPPVDHIRTLVEEDPQLRAAVVAVRSNQPVDSGGQSKLYLAGISALDQGASVPRIKNPIIDAALSDEWLISLPIPQEGILAAAKDAFDVGDYQATLDALLPHKDAEWLTQNQRAKEQLAYSLFREGQFSSAVPALEAAVIGAVGDMQEALTYYLGISFQRTGDYEKSASVLKKIYDQGGRSSLLAALGVSTSLIWLNDFEAAGRYLSPEIERLALDQSDSAAMLAVLYFNRGRVAELTLDPTVALDNYRAAIQVAPTQMSVAIQLQMVEVAGGVDTKREMIRLAADTIVGEHIPLSSSAYFDISFQARHLVRALDSLLALQENEKFGDLQSYARSEYGSVDDTPEIFLLRLLKKSAGESAEHLVAHLLSQVEQSRSALAPDKALEILRISSEIGAPADRPRARELHRSRSLRLIDSRHELSNDDLIFLLVTSSAAIQGGRLPEAQSIVDTLLRITREFGGDNALLQLVTRTQEMRLASARFDRDRALFAATETLRLIESHRKNLDDELGDGALITVRDQAEATIADMHRPLSTPEQLARENLLSKIGRNEVVAVRNPETGDTQTTKFKKVQDQLLSGKLILERRIFQVQPNRRGRR